MYQFLNDRYSGQERVTDMMLSRRSSEKLVQLNVLHGMTYEKKTASAALQARPNNDQSLSTAICTLTSHRGPLPSPYTLPKWLRMRLVTRCRILRTSSP